MICPVNSYSISSFFCILLQTTTDRPPFISRLCPYWSRLLAYNKPNWYKYSDHWPVYLLGISIIRQLTSGKFPKTMVKKTLQRCTFLKKKLMLLKYVVTFASMTSLFEHKVAQPTKWRFLLKNLNQLVIFVIGIAFTWSWVGKIGPNFRKRTT